MDRGLPDDRTVTTAIDLATRAPSVHNTQPWRWRIGDRSVHLYADLERQVSATDPDQRDLVMSCGAALHHVRVAFAALGWSTTVDRLPNPDEPDHLASLKLTDPTPSPLDPLHRPQPSFPTRQRVGAHEVTAPRNAGR